MTPFETVLVNVCANLLRLNLNREIVLTNTANLLRLNLKNEKFC